MGNQRCTLTVTSFPSHLKGHSLSKEKKLFKRTWAALYILCDTRRILFTFRGWEGLTFFARRYEDGRYKVSHSGERKEGERGARDTQVFFGAGLSMAGKSN